MWLYLPESCLSSQGAADSISDSTSPSPEPALWVTSSGTPMQRPSSWPGWKTRPWRRLLSGTTLPPSMASRGVERWISSAAGSPARTSATPGRAPESRKAHAPGSGLSTLGSFGKYDPATSSWRTSQLSLLGGSESCSETWPRSGSMRSGIAFARMKSERRTEESGSSSWPTPAAMNPNDGESPATWHARAAELKEKHGNGNGAGLPLAIAAKGWQTPTTVDAAGRDYTYPGGDHSIPFLTLPGQAKQWQTPSVADTMGGHLTRGGERSGELLLRGQAKAWPTPRAGDGEKGGPNQRDGSGSLHLTSEAVNWPTPGAHDGKGSSKPGQRRGQLDEAIAHRWPTPKASDSTRSDCPSERARNTPILESVALRSLQAPTTPKAGEPTSPPTLALSPLFVEALMGWPSGWTDCGCSETVSSRSKRRSRSENSGGEPSEAAQPAAKASSTSLLSKPSDPA